MESRMREIRTSGLTRGRTSAVIGNASHPVAFSLLYWKNNYETLSNPGDWPITFGILPAKVGY